jgi:hypothetical protein
MTAGQTTKDGFPVSSHRFDWEERLENTGKRNPAFQTSTPDAAEKISIKSHYFINRYAYIQCSFHPVNWKTEDSPPATRNLPHLGKRKQTVSGIREQACRRKQEVFYSPSGGCPHKDRPEYSNSVLSTKSRHGFRSVSIIN